MSKPRRKALTSRYLSLCLHCSETRTALSRFRRGIDRKELRCRLTRPPSPATSVLRHVGKAPEIRMIAAVAPRDANAPIPWRAFSEQGTGPQTANFNSFSTVRASMKSAS
jgi:hypothetical protein